MKSKYFICIDNRDAEASLERWKVYKAIEDNHAFKHKMIRIIDESGEDYLFPLDYFVPIDLPQTVERAMQTAIN
ncbi:hypothetical protein JXA70_03280 [candidate division KSB1 bacterium]|nr:hypothetical protein [candidate division KSB1 bacterium]